MDLERFFSKAVLEGLLRDCDKQKMLEYADWLREIGCNLLAKKIYEELMKRHFGDYRAHIMLLDNGMVKHINYLEFFEKEPTFSACSKRTIYGGPPSDESRGKLSANWAYPFKREVNENILPDVPLPVVYGCQLIVPVTDDFGEFKNFISLDVHKGEKIWEWHPGGRLTFSSTPALLHEFIYSITEEGLKVRDVNDRYQEHLYHSEEISPDVFMLPVVARYKEKEGEKVECCHMVIPSGRKICVLEMPHCEERGVLEVIYEENDRIAGVECHDGWVVVSSRKGKILTIEADGMSIRKDVRLEDAVVTSPPWKEGEYIYFEYMRQDNTRVVCAVSIPTQGEDEMIVRPLVGESGCIESHTHWDYPVAPSYDGWVLIHSHLFRGETGSIHMVKRQHNNLVIRSNRLLQRGNLNLLHAGIYSNFLIYGDGREVSSLDLRNGKKINSCSLNRAIIAGPLLYNNQCFFITKKGIECLIIS